MRAENNGYRNGQVLVNGQFRQKTKRVINILQVIFFGSFNQRQNLFKLNK